MSDKELCEAFGTTLEDVEADIEEFEHGDWSNASFSEPFYSLPTSRMKTTSLKLYDYELAAIDAAAKREGISRSEFIRRACDNELVALA